MKLEDYLSLARKLAYRTYSEEELVSVITFLEKAERDDAEAFLDEYARIVESMSIDVTVPDLPLNPMKIERRRTPGRPERGPIPQDRRAPRKTRRRWIQYIAGIILVGGLSYALVDRLGSGVLPVEEVATDVTVPIDIPPAANRATLTLANGDVIMLDSASDGQLAVQQGTRILKEADRIIYEGNRTPANEAVAFNVMSTPRGGQYTLTLSDGTRVWLNAASSITYPSVFNGQERRVRVTGEVYFEVARRDRQPFIVDAGNDRITVLGTMFNVRAYTEEGPVKTSLVEGSVRINAQLLKPGEAYVAGEVVETSLEQDIAWRNGFFHFDGMDLQMVMREIGRWYDVRIAYPNGVPKIEFGGELQRNLDLGQILKALEKSNVRFRMEIDGEREEKTIVVLN
ncbi:MAG TPA: FecR domain-containing protein [Cyclobacteriaceae bacterium]|nr:FecR domain-containing protein [Cyclobacteriaceae bacterium]